MVDAVSAHLWIRAITLSLSTCQIFKCLALCTYIITLPLQVVHAILVLLRVPGLTPCEPYGFRLLLEGDCDCVK